jgi:hypothetical protein
MKVLLESLNTEEKRKDFVEFSVKRAEICKVGDFGIPHGIGFLGYGNAFKVSQILSDNDMIVVRPEAQQEYSGDVIVYRGSPRSCLRIKGFSTKGLVDDAKWSEPIAAIGTYRYENVRGSISTILNCIPLEQVQKGLTIEQFKEMLKIKGIEETNLSELVKGKKDSEILDLLEKGVKEDKEAGQESNKDHK